MKIFLFNLLRYVSNLFMYLLQFCVPKDNKLWLFGAWFGKRYADNPRYLFEYVVKNCPDIRVVWISKDRKIVNNLRSLGFESYFKRSLRGIWYSFRAGVLIFCLERWDDLYLFNSGKQFQIQLWHGIPLKKIGVDFEGGISWSKEIGINAFWARERVRIIRNIIFPFLKREYSFMPATSGEIANIFTKAFNLNHGIVQITGFPRNDILVKKRNEKPDLKNRIIYLPTYRKGKDKFVDFFKGFDFKKWFDFLNKENLFFDIKMHPLNFLSSESEEKIKSMDRFNFVLRDVDIYEILENYGILITDYSSIFFDYLLLDRPIIFAPFDLEDYKVSRGFYFDYNEVTPGPKCRSWDEVLEWILKFKENPSLFQKERERVKNRFYSVVDSNSSERVFKHICKLAGLDKSYSFN